MGYRAIELVRSHMQGTSTFSPTPWFSLLPVTYLTECMVTIQLTMSKKDTVLMTDFAVGTIAWSLVRKAPEKQSITSATGAA